MNRSVFLLGFALPLAGLILSSCGDQGTRLGKGFRLPEGDLARGRAAFVELNCNRCHSVEGEEIPGIAAGTGLVLGGKIQRVKTYGELVTSIIDPKHTLAPGYADRLDKTQRETAESPMPLYNQIMTVQQMTDIVTFLHSCYERLEPDYHPYIYYMP